MTQSTTTNGYTQSTMNSTDVYNYMKRNARKTSSEIIDCLAEALITSYGDDTNIDKRDLKAICAKYMTDLDFRTMECHVSTQLTTVPFSVAHVD
jgi:hypothetical protein